MSLRRPSLEALYQEVDQYVPTESSDQLPRIGISANRKDGLSCIAEPYVRSVLEAGGVPVIIPVITDIRTLTALVSDLDGLVMSGGGDINPLYVKEEPIPGLQDVDTLRDEYDLILLRLAANRQIPIMGICRGHQILNVAFGGSIYQDIHSQAGHPVLKHSQAMAREYPSHSITLSPGEHRLRTILRGKAEPILINSFHHQAIKEVAPGFRETAVAADGINEAIEHTEKPVFGVQWHPEAMAPQGNERMKALFAYHIENARRFAQVKSIHQRILTIDSHTDTPMVFPGSFDLGRKEGGKVNLPYMEEGHIDAVFMVAYIPQGKRDEASFQAATDYAIERLEQVRRQQLLHPERVAIADTPQAIQKAKRQGKKAICLGIENGYAIGKRIEHLRMFKEMGVSYLTLCHNGDNDICDSARGQGEWNGLSPFGKEVVKEMNRLGIIVDVSHASERSFYDALETSQVPIIASHSSVRALCDHPRNLTDEQLKILAQQGGVAQICLYKGFIHEDPEKASLSDAIRHIDHIVELVGIDHVGIGSDFDGDGELIGCAATNELINITVRLLERGYTEEDIRKIWGGNLLRTMTAVQEHQVNNK